MWWGVGMELLTPKKARQRWSSVVENTTYDWWQCSYLIPYDTRNSHRSHCHHQSNKIRFIETLLLLKNRRRCKIWKLQVRRQARQHLSNEGALHYLLYCTEQSVWASHALSVEPEATSFGSEREKNSHKIHLFDTSWIQKLGCPNSDSKKNVQDEESAVTCNQCED